MIIFKFMRLTEDTAIRIINMYACIAVSFCRKGYAMAKERRDTKNRLLWKGEYQNADGRIYVSLYRCQRRTKIRL